MGIGTARELLGSVPPCPDAFSECNCSRYADLPPQQSRDSDSGTYSSTAATGLVANAAWEGPENFTIDSEKKNGNRKMYCSVVLK